MPPKERPGGRILDIPQRLPEAASGIGLIEMDQREVDSRFQDIVQRLGIGLRRKGEPEMGVGGMAKDGGFASFRTGVPLVNEEAWRQVPNDTEAYVASLGGTNTKHFRTKKVSPTEISTEQFAEKVFDDNTEKSLTFAQVIDLIAAPIAEDYLQKPQKDRGKLRVGVSLGFPHKYNLTEHGVDAEFVPEPPDNTLSKLWKITDWDEIPEEKRGFFGALQEAFEAKGITDIDIATPDRLVVFNDTPGTALDSSAARRANKDGLKVLEMGAVGGTGTNIAVNDNGLVNLEIGRWPLPKDQQQKADPATERALDIMVREGPDGTERRLPELEVKTGGMYLPYQLRAGVELLGEQGIIADAQRLSDQIRDKSLDPETEKPIPTFMSDLATGEIYINDTVQYLAQGVLRNASQHFGIATAAVAEAKYGSRREELPAALLVEGSLVNHATGVKGMAEVTASSLGQPIKIYEADSVKGIASLVMSWDYMDQQAA